MAESKLLGALVATLPVTEGLRPQVVQRLLKHGSVSLCQEGQALYSSGTPARQVYVVVWGKVEIQEADGKTYFARRGDLLGMEGAEPSGVYQNHAKVVTKSVLLSIRGDDFNTYFLKYQPVAAWVLTKIGERFRKESGLGGDDLDPLDPEIWLAELEADKKRVEKD